MKNIRPCPYCGGEVEVVKLIQKKNEERQPYRIQCMRCRQLVARGEGFPIETISEAEERIKDYEREIAKIWSPIGSLKFKQTEAAKVRDWVAGNPDLLGPDDEMTEIHDANIVEVNKKDLA